MIHNDVLRSLRYILNIRDAEMKKIWMLAGLEIPLEAVSAFLKSEEEEGHLLCDHETMAHFLDGLIYFKRGKDEKRPQPPIEVPVTNNTVLKKLRVAFELKEKDIIDLIEAGGIGAGQHEVSAFFRRKDHPNYRPCGDQYLRNFLRGLTLRVRN